MLGNYTKFHLPCCRSLNANASEMTSVPVTRPLGAVLRIVVNVVKGFMF